MSLARVILVVVLSLLYLVVASAEAPLTNDDVIKLSALGIGDEAVMAKVRQAGAVAFKLETDDLVKLKNAGVSGKVIAAMLDRVASTTNQGLASDGARTAPSSDAPATPDQIQADLLQMGMVSAATQIGMVEFHFSSLSDFLDIRITAARERSTVREYEVALVLPPKAVSSMSAFDAFAMLPGSKPTPPDNRPYLLVATIVYTKVGNAWTIAKFNPTRMERVSGSSVPAAHGGSERPKSGPADPSPSDAMTRTGLVYRAKTDNIPVYDKPEGPKIKDHLARGAYVANAKGSILTLPASYQPEEKNGRTHVAYFGKDLVVGWVESTALDSLSYSCGCERTNKHCTAINIAWKKRSWTDCVERAVADDQAGRRKRLEDLIRVLDAGLARVPEPAMDVRGIVNAKLWGQYDTYQGWFVASMNRRALASATLASAKLFLERNNLEPSLDYAALANRYYTDAAELNKVATAVLARQVVKSADVLSATYRVSTEALRYGVAIQAGPGTPAYDAVDFLITVADFGVDYGLEGMDTAKRNLTKTAVVKSLIGLSGLSLQSDATKLLGQSGLYEKLAGLTRDPALAKEIMATLGRSGDAAVGELTEEAVKNVIDGLSRFVSNAADPTIPNFNAPPKNIPKSGKK